MIRTTLSISIVFLLLVICGCGQPKQSATMTYPKKPPRSEERKAGRAMFFYEQAEKDMDINDSVIVIPPEEQQEEPAPASD